MHKVHHSRWQPETDSNYSSLFAVWDRLFRSFRLNPNSHNLRLGLDQLSDGRFHTVGGLLKRPTMVAVDAAVVAFGRNARADGEARRDARRTGHGDEVGVEVRAISGAGGASIHSQQALAGLVQRDLVPDARFTA
jgi:hypothetical protein